MAKNIKLPVFGSVKKANLIFEGNNFVAIKDGFPVSPGHALIIPKRKAKWFRDLTFIERQELTWTIDFIMTYITLAQPIRPCGFNVGFNDGEAAGQTMPQFHCHVIPRYKGDVEDPRGGIRHVIPNKAKYWKK